MLCGFVCKPFNLSPFLQLILFSLYLEFLMNLTTIIKTALVPLGIVGGGIAVNGHAH